MAESRVDILLALKSELKGSNEAISYLKNLAGGLSVAAIAYKAMAIASESAKLASEIKALAAEANMSTDAFQAFKVNAMAYNVSQETIVRGAVTLRNNLEAAAKNGANPLNQQLHQLKLTAVGLQALALEQQFEVIGRAIANATDKNAAFAAAMDLLGAKAAPKLLQMLKDLGVEGLDKFAQKAHGSILSEAELERLDKAGNTWERIKYDLLLLGAYATNAAVAIKDLIGADPGGSLQLFADVMARIGPLIPGFGANPFYFIAGNLHAQGTAMKEEVKRFKEEADRRASNLNEERKTQVAYVAAENRRAGQEEVMRAAKLAEFTKMQGEATQEQRLADAEARDKQAAEDMRIEEGRRRLAESREREAQSYKELADPMAKYRRDLERVEALTRENFNGTTFLSMEEAAAITEKLTFAMAGGFTPAIEAAREELLRYDEALDKIANNPFLTDQEKHRQRIEKLKEENAEIDRRVELLRKEIALHPGGDTKQASREIYALQKTKVRNAGQIGAFDPATAGVAENLRENLTKLESGLKTPAQNIAATISGTIGGAFASVHENVTGLIIGTQSWQQSLANVARTIETDLVSGIVKMFTEWIAQRAVQALASMAWSAAEGETDAAAKAPGALFSSISSWGLAAAVGVAALVAAMATVSKFETGGFTGNDVGIVHPGEFVFSAPAVNSLGLGFLDTLHETGRGSAPAAAAASGGKPTRFIHVMATRNEAREMMRNPDADNVFIDWARRNRGEFLA